MESAKAFWGCPVAVIVAGLVVAASGFAVLCYPSGPSEPPTPNLPTQYLNESGDAFQLRLARYKREMEEYPSRLDEYRSAVADGRTPVWEKRCALFVLVAGLLVAA